MNLEGNRIAESINLVKNLIIDGKTSNYQNKADTFLPIGPTTIEKQALDWPSVFKSIIEKLFNIQCKLSNWEEVQEALNEHFTKSRETRELAGVVHDIYLNAEGLKSITPLAYLICGDINNARTKTMESIFSSLINTDYRSAQQINDDGNNLLEKLVIYAFKDNCIANRDAGRDICYLPFLARLFTKDLEALKSSTSWFVDEFENLVDLYAFLYLSQLSISLGVPRLRHETPKAQPLYFILESESASKERYECNTYGYNFIFSKTAGQAKKVFPYLGYLQLISDLPLWKLTQNENNFLIQDLNNLNSNISELFDESYQEGHELKQVVEKGLELQFRVFMKTDRKTANEKVVSVFQDVFSRNFTTDRKSAGKYFELKSKTLMLLTNLVVGKGNKLLIDDVIEAFKERGVWLDVKSKWALLKFYENVGNIEKLSDSGDAVYVQSTI